MKRILCIVFVCIWILVELCACQSSSGFAETIKKTNTFYKSKRSGAQDDMTEGMTIMSSIRSYETIEPQNPEQYDLTYDIIDHLIFIKDQYYYIPSGNFPTFGKGKNCALLKYDCDGVLIEKIPAPDFSVQSMDMLLGIDLLPDGCLVMLECSGKNACLFIKDADNHILHQVELQPQTENTNYAVLNAGLAGKTGVCTEFRDDGSIGIFVQVDTTVYYFDDTLTLLQTITLPVGFNYRYCISDGVYLLGQNLTQMCEVDMNEGTYRSADDLPIPNDIKYSCRKVQYGADGKLYCEYQGVIYCCQEDGTLRKVLCWEHGTENGWGTYLILNEDSFCYISSSNERTNQVVMLKVMDESAFVNRQILSCVMLAEHNSKWLQDVITRFNMMNDVYYIDVKSYKEDSGHIDTDQFDKALLIGDIPDLVVFDSTHTSKKYYDKNLLVDFTSTHGDRILGSAKRAYSYKNHLYVLPLSMQIEFYVSADAVMKEPLTWEKLYQMEGEFLSGKCEGLFSYGNSYQLEQSVLCDFYDYKTKTANFDSEEFRRRIRFLDAMDTSYINTDYGFLQCNDFYTQNTYRLTASSIKDALVDGTIKLLDVPFKRIEAYGALKKVFEGNDFTLCGNPSTMGMGANINSFNLLGVFVDTDKQSGCDAFIEYMLSDAVQTSEYLSEDALPVTRSSMEQVIDNYRYLYYDKDPFSKDHGIASIGGITVDNGVGLSVQSEAHAAVYDRELAEQYDVIEITDEDKAAMLYFFENCDGCAGANTVIYDIYKEEISAYYAGAKTLEAVTKNMQSRISLYLNE